VSLAQSVTVRPILRIGLILPARDRTRAEILARTFPTGKGRQPASGGDVRRRRGQARTVREESRFGLVACAKPPSRPKHRGVPVNSPRGTRYGWSPRTNGVAGGLAWTQWLTTLTGESPTPSSAATGVSRTYKDTERVRSRGGGGDAPSVPSFGDISFSKVIPSPGRKENPCASGGETSEP
jgi:hypothetical protein